MITNKNNIAKNRELQALLYKHLNNTLNGVDTPDFLYVERTKISYCKDKCLIMHIIRQSALPSSVYQSQSRPVKRSSSRRSREELANLTSQQRSRSYTRRWSKATHKVRAELNQIFPGRNSFLCKKNWYDSPSIELGRKKNYLYININNIKIAKREKGGWKYPAWAYRQFARGYFNTFDHPKWDIPIAQDFAPSDDVYEIFYGYKKGAKMNFENDSQPSYTSQKSQQRESNSSVSGRANVSAYQKWKPEKEQPRDAIKEAQQLSSHMQTEEYKRFEDLVGPEIAQKLFKKTVMQAAEQQYGKPND